MFFWQMTIEQKVPGVVMLTREVENGRRKADIYFPWKKDESEVYGPYTVVCTEMKKTPMYILRVLLVKFKKIIHELFHYQFLNWSDHGAPQHLSDFMPFYDLITESNILTTSEKKVDPLNRAKKKRKSTGPSQAPIIQCSAGVGRTGTFIIIDVLLRSLNLGLADHYCVEDMILQLRAQRRMSVQVVAQVTFIYDCVIHFLLCRNQSLAKLQPLLEKRARVAPEDVDFDVYIHPDEWFIKENEIDEWIENEKAIQEAAIISSENQAEEESPYHVMKRVVDPRFVNMYK
uniref:Protein-tyrosine-phosphatase n=2 Tax=Caenorhabditis japonica TaxID=281687 RepID=A0A8R1HT27_CAEJA